MREPVAGKPVSTPLSQMEQLRPHYIQDLMMNREPVSYCALMVNRSTLMGLVIMPMSVAAYISETSREGLSMTDDLLKSLSMIGAYP